MAYKPKSFLFNIPVFKNIVMGNENLSIHIIDKNSSTDLIWLHESDFIITDHESFYKHISSKLNCNLIIPFYRGFGTSKGNTDEITLLTDITILNGVLTERKTAKFIYGHSLGCATALFLNKLTKSKGLILENPFYNMKNVVKNIQYAKYFKHIITQTWENNKRIQFADNILFIVSELDKYVLTENTDMLVPYCKKYKKILVKNADHFNAYYKDENYFLYFNDFMTNIINNQPFLIN